MPVVQSEPLKKHDDKEKREAKRRGGHNQREEVCGLHLVTGIDDGIAEAALANARGAGKELARDGADDADAGGDANAGEETGERVGQPQLKETCEGDALYMRK